ncbi:MAG: Uma2 family endonuclease [Vitreimonas sp.]
MADTARIRTRPTTLDEFLVWEEAQQDKHEFRNGQIRMMTGGTQRHNHIATNILVALRAKLGKGPCRPYAMNARVALRETEAGYYPDVVVDCGTYAANALAATKPTVVFEVLSPSTRNKDFSEKVPDYRDTESVVQIVLVEPDERRLHVWTKIGDNWRQSDVNDSNGVLELPSIGASLTFDEIYENA